MQMLTLLRLSVVGSYFYLICPCFQSLVQSLVRKYYYYLFVQRVEYAIDIIDIIEYKQH